MEGVYATLVNKQKKKRQNELNQKAVDDDGKAASIDDINKLLDAT
jgi:hypothetical protein